MTDAAIDLHPQVLRKDDKEQFVVLPWEEYLHLRELMEDAQDLRDLRRAKQEDDGSEPSVPLDEVKRRLGL